MDKNSIIGLILIALLIGTYTYFNQPNPEELKAAKQRQDSVEAVMKAQQAALAPAAAVDSGMTKDTSSAGLPDSVKQAMSRQQYGDFANALEGTETFSVIEN